MPASDNFRRNLQTVIKLRGLTQSEVAEAAGMVRPYVSRVLGGQTHPLMDQAERLAKAVGYPLPSLLGNPEEFAELVLTSVSK